MIVIRRLIDRQRAYTAIFLPGEEAQIIPTTDYEHGRILQIYKQDRPYAGVHNDFTDFGLAIVQTGQSSNRHDSQEPACQPSCQP